MTLSGIKRFSKVAPPLAAAAAFFAFFCATRHDSAKRAQCELA